MRLKKSACFFNNNSYFQKKLYNKSNTIIRLSLIGFLFTSSAFTSPIASDDSDIEEALSSSPKHSPNSLRRNDSDIGEALSTSSSSKQEGLLPKRKCKPKPPINLISKISELPTDNLPRTCPVSVPIASIKDNEGNLKLTTRGSDLEVARIRYSIPKNVLEDKKFSHWNNECREGAKNAKNSYIIKRSAFAFSEKNSSTDRVHDFYGITLNLTLDVPEELTRNNFYPKTFIVEAQPVHYNTAGNAKWELKEADTYKGLIQHYFPESASHQAEFTSTRSSTLGATAGAGLSANLLTGGPTATASGTASASYTSGSSRKITVPDVEVEAHINQDIVRWDIIFNTLPTSTFEQELKWIWNVDHKGAEKNLYSGPTQQDKDTFYFKVGLHAKFAAVDEKSKKVKYTDYLPVFPNNNGDIQQIIGLQVPKLEDENPISPKKAVSKKEKKKEKKSKSLQGPTPKENISTSTTSGSQVS